MSKNRILVVDDNEINVDVLLANLEDDYELEVANTGKEALEKVDAFYPEIILLDIMMPEMDGYEVCRRIRADVKHRYIKIVMVSAKAMPEERLEGYESGADDYLVKPFNSDELKAKIHVFLKLKSQEEMNQVKSDLLLLLSHETNTPLNSILGFSDLLLQTTTLDEKQKTYVETIRQGGEHLEKFIKKSLLLSGLRSAEMKMEFSSQSLLIMVENIITDLSVAVETKNIHFSCVDNMKKDISVQKELMGSALKNVIENAVQYSPDGEIISIFIEAKDEQCLIKISDRGEGIKTQQIDSIFDMFGIQDIEHHQKGQGLSLAIARSIAERHGGTLIAENPSEGGAMFTFSFPIK